MTALLLALLAVLPDAASRRYRVEIGGQAVGVATLSVRCERARCTGLFETALRVPEAGGGGVARRTVKVTTDREGMLLEAEAGGKRRKGAGEAVASILAEAAARRRRRKGSGAASPSRTPRPAGRGRPAPPGAGAWLEGEVLGEPVRFRSAPGGLPDEVVLPAQDTRFVADPAAAVPARAPASFGSAVPAPPGAELERSLLFCGLAPEPEDPAPPPAGLPRDFPERGNCQQKSRGLPARRPGRRARGSTRGRRGLGRDALRLARVGGGGRGASMDRGGPELPAASRAGAALRGGAVRAR